MLRWFGHVKTMYEYSTARRVLMEEVSGGRVRGRPRAIEEGRWRLRDNGREIGKSGEPWYICN